MDTRHDDEARIEAVPTRAVQPDAAVFSIAPVARRKRTLPVLAATAVAFGIVGVALAGTIGRPQPLPNVAVAAKAPVAVDVPGERTGSIGLGEGPFGPLDGRTG